MIRSVGGFRVQHLGFRVDEELRGLGFRCQKGLRKILRVLNYRTDQTLNP